jgi:hypothetical protein
MIRSGRLLFVTLLPALSDFAAFPLLLSLRGLTERCECAGVWSNRVARLCCCCWACVVEGAVWVGYPLQVHVVCASHPHACTPCACVFFPTPPASLAHMSCQPSALHGVRCWLPSFALLVGWWVAHCHEQSLQRRRTVTVTVTVVLVAGASLAPIPGLVRLSIRYYVCFVGLVDCIAACLVRFGAFPSRRQQQQLREKRCQWCGVAL